MRSSRLFLSALLFTALFFAGAAQAADFWVATTGSDSNPGTQLAPFLTISHADNAAVAGFGPGSTIHVARGTYAGEIARLITKNGTALNTTGNVISGSNQITNLGSTIGVKVGQLVMLPSLTTGLPAGVTVIGISGSTIALSAPVRATATGTPVLILTNPIAYLCDVKWSCVIKPNAAETYPAGWVIGSFSSNSVAINGIFNSGGVIKVTTAVSTPMFTGECNVLVQNVVVSANANGRWCITVIDSTNFTLNGSVFQATAGAGGIIYNGFGSTANPGAAFTIIDGFEVDGTYPGTGIRWLRGLTDPGLGVILRNNKVHDINYVGGVVNSNGGACAGGDSANGGSLSQWYSNIVFRCGPQNTIQHFMHGLYQTQSGAKIYDNLLSETSGDCITGGHNAERQVVANNTLVGCRVGISMVGGGNPYGPMLKTANVTNGSASITGLNTTADLAVGMTLEDTTNPNCIGDGTYTGGGSNGSWFIKTINNSTTITLNGPAGTTCANGDIIGFAPLEGGTQVSNNIQYGGRWANDFGIGEDAGPIGVNMYTNNNIFNVVNPWWLGGSPIIVNGHSNDIIGDPKFVNPQVDGSGDYHLMLGSVDVAAGTSTVAPSFDLSGNPFGPLYDAGVYVYNSPHSPIPRCDILLSAGASIAAGVAATPSGGVLCLGSGNYAASSTVTFSNPITVTGFPQQSVCQPDTSIGASCPALGGAAAAPSYMPILTQSLAALMFSPSANNIILEYIGAIGTGESVTGVGGCSPPVFVNIQSVLTNFTAASNWISSFNCGLFAGFSTNLIFSNNYFYKSAYAAMECLACSNALYVGNMVFQNGFTDHYLSGFNSYPGTFSHSGPSMTNNSTEKYNTAIYNPQWTCWDNHAGANNTHDHSLCVGAYDGNGEGEFTNFALDATLTTNNATQSNNVLDNGSNVFGQSSYVMCGYDTGGGGCNQNNGITGGLVTGNVNLVGAGCRIFSSPAVAVTNNNGGTPCGGSLPSETVSSITLSNFADGALNQFIHAQSNHTIATINVNMSAAYWAWQQPPGTLTISGVNSCGFRIVGNQLVQALAGSPAGVCSDFSIVAALSGMSGSPFTQAGFSLSGQ